MLIPQTNDHLDLTPQPPPADGPALTFDFPALHIGVAEYAEGPTGCTVFHFPRSVSAMVDVRGGSPGFLGEYHALDAICLAGGSLIGLEAVTGVTAELFAQAGYDPQWGKLPLVSGAIIYDYGPRDNRIYPDKELGRAALRWAVPGRFPLGQRGVGCSARVGSGFDFASGEPGGQGGAFRQVGETKIAVFTVVNAIGAITDRGGRVVRGQRDATTGAHFTLPDDLERRLAAGLPTAPTYGNTTLTVVVTNQKLDGYPLRQIGRQVHASLARAIQPFHTLNDGDVLWAVTTDEVENPALSPLALGVLASEIAWDAVLASYEQ